MNRIIVTTIMLLILSGVLNAQQLKVVLSADKNKINRDAGKGVATVVFESSMKDLEIIDEMDDERFDFADGIVLYLIEPESEEYVRDLGYPRRGFTLKSPKTSEYILETPEIRPNTVLYYTVTLPNVFPLSLSAEYLFTKSAKYGVRLSFGKQLGGYISYKWGEYSASGNNIDDIHIDADFTNAENLGYIRRSVTGGVRLGIIHKSVKNTNNGLYLLVGCGYGEYGRQWKNKTQVDGNIYFYSDYMKGFTGELALQVMAYDWATVSVGADMLFANGKVSVDYMIGLGINLNVSKLSKKKL